MLMPGTVMLVLDASFALTVARPPIAIDSLWALMTLAMMSAVPVC